MLETQLRDLTAFGAARLASRAYGGAREDVLSFGRALVLPDDDFQVVVREALVTLYPVAMISGDAAEIAC